MERAEVEGELLRCPNCAFTATINSCGKMAQHINGKTACATNKFPINVINGFLSRWREFSAPESGRCL